MTARVLVAGIGNVFLGDDAFGVEVAERLQAQEVPESVRVADFGIRGVHLAYELLENYELAILVDAAPRGGTPGNLYVIEPEVGASRHASDEPPAPLMDAHSMDPGAVLSMLESLGGSDVRMLVLGCEPADVSERMGLSEPVAAAVERAIPMILELIENETDERPQRGHGPRAKDRKGGVARDPQSDQAGDRRGPGGRGDPVSTRHRPVSEDPRHVTMGALDA